MKDVITSVDAYRIADAVRVTLSNAECRFGYRDSFFKHERHVLLGCAMKLIPGQATEALVKLEQIIAKRKEEQPFAVACAGCLFKNVEFSSDAEIEKLKQDIDVPQEFIDKKRIPAAWLVERAGLKGYRLGNIEVSDKHANFVLNLGGGTADEVAQVISIIQMKVRDQFGLPLKTEVQFMGF
jgi:UDP-N-acetylmuramate dehydrogenase